MFHHRAEWSTGCGDLMLGTIFDLERIGECAVVYAYSVGYRSQEDGRT
jgi:hypothetical protein